jgi:hypothetical protein
MVTGAGPAAGVPWFRGEGIEYDCVLFFSDVPAQRGRRPAAEPEPTPVERDDHPG